MPSLSSSLPRFALRRPVTIWMGVIALTVIGIIAYFRIPQQLFPSGYNFPFLYVRISYPNSTPKEVEDKIVRPGERMLSTLKGLKRLRSWARGNHGSFWMRFDGSTPMTVVYQQLRDRMERLMPTLPDGVERYFIWKWDPEAEPILFFGISMKNRPQDYYRILEQHLFSRLRRLPGVSKIQLSGLEKPYIRIEVDRKKAQGQRLSIYRLIRQLRRDNLATPMGELRNGSNVYYVRSHNRLKSIEDLKNYPVATGVRLQDVANIRFVPNSSNQLFRIDGRSGIFIEVFKSSDANTVALTRSIRRILKERLGKDPALAPFQMHTFVDQGQLIEKAIGQLQQALFWGGIFALLILIIFLRHFRMTMLVMLAIPLSLIMTLGTLYFMGETINMFSLMGLMLSVGMVVDNAIVVVENIARLKQEGEESRSASTKGTAEVAMAVLMATSTTAIVFLPLMLMSGSRMLRFYMGKIGYPVIIALAASLMVALLVVPLGAAHLLGKSKPKPWPLFDRITLRYRNLLHWLLLHRFDATLITLVLFATIQYPMKHMQRTDRGRARNSRIRLRFGFTKNYSFRQKHKYLRQVEEIIKKNKKKWGVRHYTTQLRSTSSRGRISVYLDPTASKLKLNRRNLRKLMSKVLPEAPGVTRRVGWRKLGGGAGSSITLRLYGPDSQTLHQVAVRLEKHLRNDRDFAKAEADINEDTLPEIQLKLQRLWAFRYQMPAVVVGGNVSYALSGRRLRSMQQGDFSLPVWISYRTKDRSSYQQLKQIGVASWKSPQMVPLEQLVHAKFGRGPQVINRVNRKTFLKFSIAVQGKNLMRLYQRLDSVMESFPMPEGYSWGKGFRYRDMRAADASRQFALILSVTFVFLLMGILFESFALPFSVIFSIPLAFLGVYWLLYLTGTAFDMMAGIGLIMLIGIVVNHAIVLIDRVNQLRKEDMKRHDAILEAACQRLRPILMTTLTTICGLLPMAMGGSTFIGMPYAPLGRTVIGGLATSALLSLLVIPIFYTLIDDMREAFTRRVARQKSKVGSRES